MAVRIGTSGWHYRHWVGPVYPPKTRSADFFAHYARLFDTVEVNATFYRLPAPKTVAGWRGAAPEGFVFACKASRYITHMKKLRDPKTSTRKFFAATAGFGGSLGPVLFQLPPRWSANPGRLAAFLAALPAGRRYAFEFRDESWFAPEIMELLARHGAAFCIYDLAGRTAPLTLTADFVYLRLHGPGEAYGGSYGRRALARWAERIAAWAGDGRAVWCYFDNDKAGYAVVNARALKEIVAERRGG